VLFRAVRSSAWLGGACSANVTAAATTVDLSPSVSAFGLQCSIHRRTRRGRLLADAELLCYHTPRSFPVECAQALPMAPCPSQEPVSFNAMAQPIDGPPFTLGRRAGTHGTARAHGSQAGHPSLQTPKDPVILQPSRATRTTEARCPTGTLLSLPHASSLGRCGSCAARRRLEPSSCCPAEWQQRPCAHSTCT
jgi:hypothetical protein